MRITYERRALGWALLAAVFSLGSTVLIAIPIQHLGKSTPAAAPVLVSTASAQAPTPELLDEGLKLFTGTCTDCHGDDAHGDEGPDLHHLAISNSRISATITNGVKGKMPSFAKKYSDQQRGAIVAYVRSLH